VDKPAAKPRQTALLQNDLRLPARLLRRANATKLLRIAEGLAPDPITRPPPNFHT
jgi:hypothetical protein